MFTRWLTNRRKKLCDEAYKNGYDWAAGKILRGGTRPSDIESAIYCEDDTPIQRSFTRGANAAVSKLISIGVCVDDRVGI